MKALSVNKQHIERSCHSAEDGMSLVTRSGQEDYLEPEDTR